MRILIAEDDQVLADGLMRSLRGSGAAVDHVANGEAAVEAAGCAGSSVNSGRSSSSGKSSSSRSAIIPPSGP